MFECLSGTVGSLFVPTIVCTRNIVVNAIIADIIMSYVFCYDLLSLGFLLFTKRTAYVDSCYERDATYVHFYLWRTERACLFMSYACNERK